MSSRYEARDMDTHAVVVDTLGGSVFAVPTLAAAEAEAARLNAETPKRAAAVTMWAIVHPGGQIGPVFLNRELARGLCRSGDRIARVEIREIDE